MTAPEPSNHSRHFYLLTLSALGVVYGDIGTSPLYALRECFHGSHVVPLTAHNVMGVLSLIFWALVIVISIKYLLFVLRADNRGEGGEMALTALIRGRKKKIKTRAQYVLICLGLFGGALLYGDGMITPAISVLSAIEGLRVATPLFDPYVVPITLVILVALFSFQRLGTKGVGVLFGPVILVWFFTLAVLGVIWIVREPSVLLSVNPWYGLRFFLENGVIGFLVLGAVFLVVTGGEALYADMGHFGPRPIRLTWFWIVLPGLLLNYFGQGALLLQQPSAAENPFYALVPRWGIYPLVILAAAATIIASQAVISGAFSLTRQAMNLGYLPRIPIVHTSATEIGQIYIPRVNWALMIFTLLLVLFFRTSSNLAAAYGVAVSTTMVITTILACVIARRLWKWSPWLVAGLLILFLGIDLAFLGANATKIGEGGWFPLVIGAAVFTLMTTWNTGRRILAERIKEVSQPLQPFMEKDTGKAAARVPGTAVFMTSNPNSTPHALVHNLKHNKILHERIALLTVHTEDVPHVPPAERLKINKLVHNYYRVTVSYGYQDDQDIPLILKRAKEQGLEIDMDDTTFFLGRETLLATKRKGMALWREKLFAVMSKNAERATTFFRIPPGRVIEIGTQIEL